jgi:hypothetical protein
MLKYVKELSRLSSKDLYYRDGFLKGKYPSKTFTVEETARMFSPPMGLRLWMDMSLLSYIIQKPCIHLSGCCKSSRNTFPKRE